MRQSELVKKLNGEYLKTYRKIEILCRNISFFISSDNYFQFDILEEALDLLLELQENNQPVELVFGQNLYQFIYSRYRQYYDYHFSFANVTMAVLVLMLLLGQFFPNLFAYDYMETKYYIFLLIPFLSRYLYLLNQNLYLKVFFKMRKVINKYIFIVLNLVELLLILFGLAFVSHYIPPLYTDGTFGWFMPILLMVMFSDMLLKGLRKSGIIQKDDQEELLDQYLSHCHFLKMRRKETHDIPLTNFDYFTKLQKRHYLYRRLFPVMIGIEIISFILFMKGFQISVFYIIIVGYVVYSVYNDYRYFQIKGMIDDVCERGRNIPE